MFKGNHENEKETGHDGKQFGVEQKSSLFIAFQKAKKAI